MTTAIQTKTTQALTSAANSK